MPGRQPQLSSAVWQPCPARSWSATASAGPAGACRTPSSDRSSGGPRDMRILINTLSALKPKTGVGHYAANLFAALRGLLGEEAVGGFPRGWLERVARRNGSGDGGTPGPVGRVVRGLGRTLFQMSFSRTVRQFDLYHEPNFIPWETETPTVLTLHDLSVLRQPDWHPADRVRWYER